MTAIHSVAGLLPAGAGLLRGRPFRAPHHTDLGRGAGRRRVDAAAGRDQSRAPRRAVSRRDAGVQPPRARSAAPAARRRRRHDRARRSATAIFPARFVLVGAMNPCPCGFLGDPRAAVPLHAAASRSLRVAAVRSARDRIDLTVDVPAFRHELTDWERRRADRAPSANGCSGPRPPTHARGDTRAPPTPASRPRALRKVCELDARRPPAPAGGRQARPHRARVRSRAARRADHRRSRTAPSGAFDSAEASVSR